MKDTKLNIDYGLIQGCYWLLAAVPVPHPGPSPV